MNSTPRDFNVSTFSIVAECNHIFPFIAGEIKIGARVASAMAAIEPVTPRTIVFPAPRNRTTLRTPVFSGRRLEFFLMQDRRSTLDQTPTQISLGIHDVSKFLQVFLCGPADDGVSIFRPGFHF